MPRQHRRDPDDAPELTREWFQQADRIQDGPEALRSYLERTKRKGRGPQKVHTKQLVSLRLSRDVITKYKGTGRGWQSRINEDLVKASKKLKATR